MTERIMRVGTRQVHAQIVPCGGTSAGLRTLELRVWRLCLSVTLDMWACVLPAERPSPMADSLSQDQRRNESAMS